MLATITSIIYVVFISERLRSEFLGDQIFLTFIHLCIISRSNVNHTFTPDVIYGNVIKTCLAEVRADPWGLNKYNFIQGW